jgi:hypothetical protein
MARGGPIIGGYGWWRAGIRFIHEKTWRQSQLSSIWLPPP